MSRMDMLVSYFPGSTVPMYTGRIIRDRVTSSTIGTREDNTRDVQENYETKFRKLFHEIIDKAVSKSGNDVEKQLAKIDVPLLDRRSRQTRKKRRAFKYDQRLVATIIDTCESASNREGYIDAMQRFVNVHVYGECGAPCPGDTLQVRII